VNQKASLWFGKTRPLPLVSAKLRLLGRWIRGMTTSEQGLADMKAAENVALRPELKSLFLEGLAPPELEELMAAAKVRRLFARHVVVHAGDVATQVYLLRSGRAQYFGVSDEGEKTILHWIQPGDIFGILALLPGLRYHLISVEMVKDGSALVWDGDTVRNLAFRVPRLFQNALDRMNGLLVRMYYIHMSLSSQSAAHRLKQAVVDLSHGVGRVGSHGVEIDITNEELANMANITTFTASRFLSAWQRRGALQKRRGGILLRSQERLLDLEV